MIEKIKERIDFKKIVEYIGLIFVILVEIFITIGIGKYNGTNLDYLYAVIGIFSMIYLIYRKFVLKNLKVITNVFDVLVVLLCFSSAIPVIFKTAVSLNNAIIVCFKYMCCLNLYIVIKNVFENKKHFVIVFKNALIVCMLFLCICALDLSMSKGMVTFLNEKLNMPIDTGSRDILFSTIGYNNTFATILGCVWIILLDQYLNVKNKIIKNIYALISYIYVVCMLATISIGGLGVTAVAGIAYYIFSKEKRKELISVVAPSCIVGIIYYASFRNMLLEQSYLKIWIMLMVTNLLNLILIHITNMFFDKIDRKGKKILVITMSVLAVLVAILVFVGLRCFTPLKLFKNGKSATTQQTILLNVETNANYTIELDIDAKVLNNNPKEIYTIMITQQNRFSDGISKKVIRFGQFKGTKKMEFVTMPDCTYINIRYISSDKDLQDTLSINSLKVNGKERPVNYLYLPHELVYKVLLMFEDNVESKSVYERIECMNIGWKIGKENWLFGTGGNSWNLLYHYYQSYYFNDNNSHFYIFQIFLEFGIIGILSYLCITGYVIKYMLKKKKNIDIALAILIIVAHSLLDFDLVYLLVLYNWIFMLGILSSEEESTWKINSKLVYIVLPILIAVNIYMSGFAIEKANLENANKQEYNFEKTEEFLQRYGFDRNRRKEYLENKMKDINKNPKAELTDIEKVIKQYITYIENEPRYQNLSLHSDVLIMLYNPYYDVPQDEKQDVLRKQYVYIEKEANELSLNIDAKINFLKSVVSYIRTIKNNSNMTDDFEFEMYNKYYVLYQKIYDTTYNEIMNNANLRLNEGLKASKIRMLETQNGILQEIMQ